INRTHMANNTLKDNTPCQRKMHLEVTHIEQGFASNQCICHLLLLTARVKFYYSKPQELLAGPLLLPGDGVQRTLALLDQLHRPNKLCDGQNCPQSPQVEATYDKCYEQ